MGNNIHCCDTRFQDKEETDSLPFKQRKSIVPKDRPNRETRQKFKNLFKNKPNRHSMAGSKPANWTGSLGSYEEESINKPQKVDFSLLKQTLDRQNGKEPQTCSKIGRFHSVLEKYGGATQENVLNDLYEEDKDDMPFDLNITPIHTGRNPSGVGEIDVSCILETNGDVCNESIAELHHEIEKSISNSQSKSASYRKSFGPDISGFECENGTPETKPSLDWNYVTFGLAERGRRTNDAFCKPCEEPSGLPNYSTNECSEQAQ